MQIRTVFATTAALCFAAGTTFANDGAEKTFKVVGTWGNLSSWQNVEQPFWADSLPAATNGKIGGDAIPITEAGLKGTEVMRLLSLGVFEVAHGLGSYVASENPAIEGADLSSIATDFTTMRAVVDAYRPTMDELFRNTYGATIVALHPWPASMIYCRDEISGISDLEGRKVRVHSATLGDFVEGAGGVTVTLPFAEVVPALEKGVADCAITDPVSAFKASWHEVINHVFALPVGYSITFTAVNAKLWDGLDAETRETMQAAFDDMVNDGWTLAESEQEMGVGCLTGTVDECTLGTPGDAVLHRPSEDDTAARQTILDDFVLARWADRCGADCVNAWNATAGQASGLVAPAPGG
ncbi:TRAP transporter substrate-binding protein [Primorskyibacter flagellatus]|uniref:TRAP-type C4-dicarboxylate transport system, substrate-binding protein n=1 Tax=Primorskyibacter flagellatus TaxID=1387277 RepID=A0A1W2EJ71_9RHOB|nr:TRAP transporter substrate-binding protein [Primorskyibacter flagellatus]SMD09743.1 TRAP-type C4-dicarboxylate transport system, substrate-binding protein [Primorskyibacter flagellatus]